MIHGISFEYICCKAGVSYSLLVYQYHSISCISVFLYASVCNIRSENMAFCQGEDNPEEYAICFWCFVMIFLRCPSNSIRKNCADFSDSQWSDSWVSLLQCLYLPHPHRLHLSSHQWFGGEDTTVNCHNITTWRMKLVGLLLHTCFNLLRAKSL